MTKKITRTCVTVIQRDGEAVLVRYQLDGAEKRVFIPVSELGDGYVLDDVLVQAVEYGYPWQECNLVLDAQRFETEMHNAGLWTAEDVLRNPQGLFTALNATFAPVVSEILTLAKQDKRRSIK